MAGVVGRQVPMEWNGQMVPLGRHVAHSGTITSLSSIRSKGDFLLSSSEDKTAVLWSIIKENNQVRLTKRQILGEHPQMISDACFASKGNQVVLVGGDKLLYLYDLKYPTMPRIFKGHQDRITSVHVRSDNQIICTSSRDRTVKLWSAEGCQFTLGESEGGHRDWVSSARFSQDRASPLFSSAGWDQLAKVWDLRFCRDPHSYENHRGHVKAALLSPDATLLATGGQDGVVGLWDSLEEEYITCSHFDHPIQAIAYHPTECALAIASYHNIYLWNVGRGFVQQNLIPFDKRGSKGRLPVCKSVTWNPDGNMLLAGYSDGHIRMWEKIN